MREFMILILFETCNEIEKTLFLLIKWMSKTSKMNENYCFFELIEQ